MVLWLEVRRPDARGRADGPRASALGILVRCLFNNIVGPVLRFATATELLPTPSSCPRSPCLGDSHLLRTSTLGSALIEP